MTSPLFDVSELNTLEHDLGKVPGLLVQAVTAATENSGFRLRDGWRDGITASQGSPTAIPFLPAAVTSEMKFGFGSIGVQVGPDNARKQGQLGRIHEYGTATSSAHMSGHKAADMEAPRYARSLDAAIVFGMKPVTRG